MHITRRLAAGLLTGCLLMGLFGCGGTNEETSSAPPTTTTAPTTTTTTAPPMSINMLTGQRDMATDNDRPIAFVVTDETATLVQLNLESADLFIEAETEAGIPRILAVYSSIDRIPDTIGPVRSARPHFVKLAKALDCIYCHIGGSNTGLETIKQLHVDDLTGAYEINSILKASKNFSWNRSAFTKAKVLPLIAKRKLRTTTTTSSPFLFGDNTGTNPATTVVVKLSESYDMAFTYDSATGLYNKHRNTLSSPVHTTYTGGTIAASNVIVMYDHRTFDEVYTSSSGGKSNRYDFDLVAGSGVLASGGTSRNIRWKRTNDQLSFFESDNSTPLTVATGKTFICLVSDTLKGRTSMY